MFPELTKDILQAERFDSRSDAEEAAHAVGVQHLGLHPEAQAFLLDDREIFVVYVGGGVYLKAFRVTVAESCGQSEGSDMSVTVTPHSTPEQYAWQAFGRAVCHARDLDWPTFHAQIAAESGWRNGLTSPAGAEGIAQIIPRWHPTMAGKTMDPLASLEYAASFMVDLLHRRAGDYREALADYNAGPASTGAARAEGYRYADGIMAAAKGAWPTA